ncbi:MaoC/PaaZ C-terminal domain-containing protein [Sphingopyxis sp.]|uniref:MaoC/PaaZ C-terminal domain-containing protein n=1 Tax=Sphingopyxis sp. TaxID=1908224 RepID=UPI003D6D513B
MAADGVGGLSGLPRSASGRPVVSLAGYRDWIGRTFHSDWCLVDQQLVTAFAVLTGDEASIHVDPQAAARTRFGGCVAHGLLLVSLLPRLMRSAAPLVSGTDMGANYGYDRVRFLEPVPVGSRVRCALTLQEMEERRPGFWLLRYAFDIERDGSPALSATGGWTIARWMKSGAAEPAV